MFGTMFGAAPESGEGAGIQPDQWRINNPQDNTQFILDKIKEVDERLTKQMRCEHGPFEYKFASAFGPATYWKTCETCGLKMGEVSHKQKLKEQLSFHESEADRLRSALLKNFPDNEDAK